MSDQANQRPAVKMIEAGDIFQVKHSQRQSLFMDHEIRDPVMDGIASLYAVQKGMIVDNTFYGDGLQDVAVVAIAEATPYIRAQAVLEILDFLEGEWRQQFIADGLSPDGRQRTTGMHYSLATVADKIGERMKVEVERR